MRICWPSRDRRPARPSTTLGFDEVERAHERGHEACGWEVVDLKRRADLLDPAVAHHHHPVGERERLLLIVRDIDRRDPQLALDRANLVAQRHADLGIERRQRLIQQQYLRLDRQRPRQRHALLLPTRHLVGVAVAEIGEMDDPSSLSTRFLMAFGRLRTFNPKPTLPATVMFGNSA